MSKSAEQTNGSSYCDPLHTTSNRDNLPLVPVVALGASAGGLEPIESFFDFIANNTGAAFVLIQHLSPDFKSMMSDLLAHHTGMDVKLGTDGTHIKPNTVYLNQPRTEMRLDGNQLRVVEREDQKALFLPVDTFFESLATERGSESIALVVSGTGSDGTKGSKAIVNASGSVLVQDPDTTRFGGMPQSVMSSGEYSLMADPPYLAKAVAHLLNKQPLANFQAQHRPAKEGPFFQIFSMLNDEFGIDFTQYKETTINRRIERRAQMKGIADLEQYCEILTDNKPELLELHADLLIEVTEFFRDPVAFGVLQNEALPELLSEFKDGDTFRAWVPGCASGEEAYSIAILILEQARAMGIELKLKVLATDCHARSMNHARIGQYPQKALASVPSDIVERYFDLAKDEAQVKQSLRDSLFFSTHDVTRSAPFSRIDLVSCRNLLIYLKNDAQDRVMRSLHFSLRKNGVLFLGSSEQIGDIKDEFDIVNEKWRLYTKRRDINLLSEESVFQNATKELNSLYKQKSPQILNNNLSPGISSTNASRDAKYAALDAIVSSYAPPGFLLTENGSLVYIFGDAGKLLPQNTGAYSDLLVDLIAPELKDIVTAALIHKSTIGEQGFKRITDIEQLDGSLISYQTTLSKLNFPIDSINYLLLLIDQVETLDTSDIGINAVMQESSDADIDTITLLKNRLHFSEESLQSTNEELETSNEELQSTNEELRSSNEELQSTNEELHSVNEELYTVSAEHQRKIVELNESSADIQLLLQTSGIATIHFDEALQLQRYTNQTSTIFNITKRDIGRPLREIMLLSPHKEILPLVEKVKESLLAQECEVTVDDETYLLRLVPYTPIGVESAAVGVLVAIVDVSVISDVKAKLLSESKKLGQIVEGTLSLIVKWDARNMVIKYCNESFADRHNSTVSELVGSGVSSLSVSKGTIEFLNNLGNLKPGEHATDIATAVIEKNGKMISQKALMTTEALSSDGITVDEYLSIGVNCPEHFQLIDTRAHDQNKKMN